MPGRVLPASAYTDTGLSGLAGAVFGGAAGDLGGDAVDAVRGAADTITDPAGAVSGALGNIGGTILGPVAEVTLMVVLAGAGAGLIVWAILRLTRTSDTAKSVLPAAAGAAGGTAAQVAATAALA